MTYLGLGQYFGQPYWALISIFFLPYRKTKEDEFVEVFKIWANKKKDKKRTKKITVQGTCCWEIYSRTGDSQKNIRPGQTLTPSVAYIKKLKTKKC